MKDKAVLFIQKNVIHFSRVVGNVDGCQMIKKNAILNNHFPLKRKYNIGINR